MGTGTIATEHMVAAIRMLGHEPLWVVSRRRRDAAAFADDLGIPCSTTDLARVLRDPAVRFGYVSARVKRRPHYIAALAEAGKHILCDGPIADRSATARSLAEMCATKGVVLAVNQTFRDSVIHQTMRRLIDDGEIGAVRSLLIVRGGPHQPPPNRRADGDDEAGDLALDITVNDIDLARFLTGAEPVEVTGIAPPDALGEHLSYAVRMDDGSIFQAHESFRTAEMESVVIVAGERGGLIAHGTLNGRTSCTLVRRIGARNELIPVRERSTPLATIRDFVAADPHGPSWLATGEDNAIALRTAEAVVTASRKRRAITLGPGDSRRSTS